MKECIVISLEGTALVFNYRTISADEEKFVNNNSFYKDSLFYTLKYYKNNKKKVYDTIEVNTNNLYVSTMRISRLVTFKYDVMLFEGLNLSSLILDFSSTIDMEDYELFLTSESLKNIDCYFMPSTYVTKFTQKGVKVNMFSTKKLSNRFMSDQNVLTEDSLYYKKTVNINEDYPELIDDIT